MVPDALARFVLPLKHDYVGHMLIPMIPIPDKSSKIVACVVVHPVFCRQGMPEYILTDCSCEFDTQALNTIAQELGIDEKRISALHPQANNNVERLKCTLSQMLRKSTEECGDYWNLEVLFLQFNYMTHDHSATGYSPFYLTQGCAMYAKTGSYSRAS